MSTLPILDPSSMRTQDSGTKSPPFPNPRCLHDIAVPTSTYLLSYSLTTLNNDVATRMGTVEFKHLLTLHIDRFNALKVITRTPCPRRTASTNSAGSRVPCLGGQTRLVSAMISMSLENVLIYLFLLRHDCPRPAGHLQSPSR